MSSSSCLWRLWLLPWKSIKWITFSKRRIFYLWLGRNFCYSTSSKTNIDKRKFTISVTRILLGRCKFHEHLQIVFTRRSKIVEWKWIAIKVDCIKNIRWWKDSTMKRDEMKSVRGQTRERYRSYLFFGFTKKVFLCLKKLLKFNIIFLSSLFFQCWTKWLQTVRQVANVFVFNLKIVYYQ